MSLNFVTAMAVKSFDAPDKRRCQEKAEYDLVSVNDYSMARLVLHPGWRWSVCLRAPGETGLCQHHHLGFCVSGLMEVQSSDGQHSTVHANDSYAIPPGHDEWVAGPEPFVAIEFLGAAALGRRTSQGMHARI